MASNHTILPYRTDEADLRRLLEARARGRTLDQIRTLGFSPKSFDGVVATATALGLIHDRTAELTPEGRSFAVATDAERAEILARQLRIYPPYSLALDAILLHDGPAPTPLGWLETWWAAHRFGGSESNRAEAAPVFAKLVDAAGLGRYVQGRKGHPSRIEWTADAATLLPVPGSAAPRPADGDAARAATPQPDPVPAPPPPLSPTPVRAESGSEEVVHTRSATGAASTAASTELRWHLGPGREVVLRLPAELSTSERDRLRRLLLLLLDP
jgi:hypothetical protein